MYRRFGNKNKQDLSAYELENFIDAGSRTSPMQLV